MQNKLKRLGFLTFLPADGKDALIDEEEKLAMKFSKTLFAYLQIPEAYTTVKLKDFRNLIQRVIPALNDNVSDMLLVKLISAIIHKQMLSRKEQELGKIIDEPEHLLK